MAADDIMFVANIAVVARNATSIRFLVLVPNTTPPSLHRRNSHRPRAGAVAFRE
ncbi:hypothetical protein [Bradyrhizobium sp. Y-H1]|jgi:hypothetical protein|uniref:hypothetical protein n=1 Tax=Bradyrhizobium sp. Y-H1 TaxID=2485167 RepID=UPI0014052ABD|nr:hypothetical protein [Bradyrhizobium sp. Y-H1]